MLFLSRCFAKPLLAVAALVLIGGPVFAQFEDPSQKMLQKHLPWRVHQATGDKVVGVLLYDPQPILSFEGRSGPADQMCFAYDGLSYRWVYVPTDAPNPMITNLQVPIGKDNNGGKMIFPKLNMASPTSVKAHGIDTHYVLVEVEVNNGAGSPPNDSFAATKFKVLEGTQEYPLKVSSVIDQIKKDYPKFIKEHEPKIETAMAKVQKFSLKDQKPSGPRVKTELMYITWMNKDSTLQVRLLTKLTDGNYYNAGGGGGKPFPLPVPPLKDPKPLPPAPQANAAPAQPPAAQPAAPAKAPLLPPPPPPFLQFKAGVEFGVIYGCIYTVNKEGKVTETKFLEPETYTHVIPPPAGFGGGPFGGPQPVPPLKD